VGNFEFARPPVLSGVSLLCVLWRNVVTLFIRGSSEVCSINFSNRFANSFSGYNVIHSSSPSRGHRPPKHNYYAKLG